MDGEAGGYQVELFVYDLSKGMAKSLSPVLLGKQIEGIWHTGVVAYGREYFFGSSGIESCRPGGTLLGEPERVEALGESQVPYQLFLEYIFGLGESAYRPGAYDLLKHNCNNFSDELSNFLCGRGVPKAILQLPEEVLNTALGASLNEALKKAELRDSNSRSVNFGPLNPLRLPTSLPLGGGRSHQDPEFDELNEAIDRIRNNSVALEERRNSINDKLSKKERKERRRDKRERKEKKRQEREARRAEEGTSKKIRNKPLLSEVDSLDDRASQSSDVSASTSRLEQDKQCHQSDSLNRNESSPETEEKFEAVADFWADQDNSDTADCQTTNTKDQSTSVNESININSLDSSENKEDHRIGGDIAGEVTAEQIPDMEDSTQAEQPQNVVPEQEREEAPEVEREPPIIFKDDLDTRTDFAALAEALKGQLSTAEQSHLEELRTYVVEDDGAWALGEDFGDLFTRILHDPALPPSAPHRLTRLLAAAALKDDVILLLHQDRKHHTIMNFANRVEKLGPETQEALALFFCNMFEHPSPSEWLLYISEWAAEGQPSVSNIRVTTKVAVNALLHPDPKVSGYGTAIMYNLGAKEVKTVIFDDVAPELAMAILQYLNARPGEELLWRALTALCRFCYSSSEVPSLIKMIGPEPSSFKGASARIDSVIEEIEVKLARVRLF